MKYIVHWYPRGAKHPHTGYDDNLQELKSWMRTLSNGTRFEVGKREGAAYRTTIRCTVWDGRLYTDKNQRRV